MLAWAVPALKMETFSWTTASARKVISSLSLWKSSSLTTCPKSTIAVQPCSSHSEERLRFKGRQAPPRAGHCRCCCLLQQTCVTAPRLRKSVLPTYKLLGKGKKRNQMPIHSCSATTHRTTTILVSPNPSVPHLKANKGDLHREDRSQAVDSAVGYVYPVGEASGQHQHKNVQGDQVNQKDVATPWGDLARETKKKQVPGLNTLHGRAQTEHVWFSWGSHAGLSLGSNPEIHSPQGGHC